jgi:hypothetical protein
LAFLARINCQVAHALNEAAMGALHTSAAAPACEHGRLYRYILLTQSTQHRKRYLTVNFFKPPTSRALN